MSAPPDYTRIGDGFRIQYDWSSTPPSTAVAEAVAFAKNQDPIDLERLHDYVDFDALDALVGSNRPTDAGELTLSFRFDDYEVVVHQAGTVAVEPAESIH